jgi:predicted nucleotidyltransferase component of viral defense system
MSQPPMLPDGVWQSLFRSALMVVGEIRKHGGRADPFFTFGGGTVLMLRYRHRMSKDIDFFVPDPQSLAYVTPRLSDVAETLCNSQYVEAALYVKLQLEAGEIDFVAAPNLLPEEHAFERWDLFGESVRVETAAEIVAKKIFHRGDKATARDLFDLALVLDRAPDAMALAQPFLFRHADKFVEHLQTPSDGFVRQFRDIYTNPNP